MRYRPRIARRIVLGVVCATLIATLAFNREAARAADAGSGLPDFRHVQVNNPAKLTNAETERIYEVIKDRQFEAYARSGNETATSFKNWRRYNRTPYLSSTHGNRFINNYANDLATGYETLESGDEMPPGAAFAKDSFVVEDDGTVRAGRLFIMEKLAAGSRESTYDWRYVFIDSNGDILGDNLNKDDPRVEFCHTCHKVRSDRDFLFFVPPAHRTE